MKISVIIPCFNQGSFLKDALASVESQEVEAEIIVINDGSTDPETLQILKSLQTRGNLRVIHQQNQGLAATRNRGVQDCTGEFVQFLDSDDLLLPGKFLKQLEAFDRHPGLSVSVTDYVLRRDGITEHLHPRSDAQIRDEPFQDFLFRWERGLSVPIHCGLFKKSVWKHQPPFNQYLRAKEDWVMWTRLAKDGVSFEHVHEPLAVYRMHDSNMCKDVSQMGKFFLCAALEIARMIDDPPLRRQFGESVDAHLKTYYYQMSAERLEKFDKLIAKLNRFPRARAVLKRCHDILFNERPTNSSGAG